MKWPRWRFEKELGKLEADEQEDEKVSQAKAEAVDALTESYEQLEHVRELNRQHEPVRRQLRPIRERNGFAEGLMRVIEEGR